MFSTQALLDRLAPCRDAPAWWLGLSGGLDSMVLLAALAQARSEQTLPPLQAVHIHHGLHPQADDWARHCQQHCDSLGIPLTIARVSVAPGASLENAARDARYAVFERLLAPGEQLLLAHHRDDQLETLLFRLLRGTGLLGLSGMPESRPLGAGMIRRPLLSVGRTELLAWARQQRLVWIEDPANRDPRFARTGLRHEVLPALRRLWPGTEASLLRMADHAREATELLDEVASQDLSGCAAPPDDPWLQCWPSLAITPLLALSPARQRNLLRYWLRQAGRSLPDARQLDALLEQVSAAVDSQPLVRWEGVQLSRSADRLWMLQEADAPPAQAQRLQIGSDRQVLAAGRGVLSLEPAAEGLTLDRGLWELRYRSGSERIRLDGRRPRQALKGLFQDAGIPVWLRQSVPLLYRDGELVSVAGRWNDPSACAGPGERGWTVIWEPHGRPA